MATLTLTITDTNVSSVYVNGEELEGSTTMEVPVGTIVECSTSVESSSDRNLAYLSINGVKTYHSEGDGFYPEYIVVGDATISVLKTTKVLVILGAISTSLRDNSIIQ